MRGDRKRLGPHVLSLIWAAVCASSSVPLVVVELLSLLLFPVTSVSHLECGGRRPAL